MATAGVIEWGFRRPPSTIMGFERIMTADMLSSGTEQLGLLQRRKPLSPYTDFRGSTTLLT